MTLPPSFLAIMRLVHAFGRDRYQQGLEDARNIAEDVLNHLPEDHAARFVIDRIAHRINDAIASRME